MIQLETKWTVLRFANTDTVKSNLDKKGNIVPSLSLQHHDLLNVVLIAPFLSDPAIFLPLTAYQIYKGKILDMDEKSNADNNLKEKTKKERHSSLEPNPKYDTQRDKNVGLGQE